jgi:hypothetical protein
MSDPLTRRVELREKAEQAIREALCDCGHPRHRHIDRDRSLGNNPIYREECQDCSCIDFQPGEAREARS